MQTLSNVKIPGRIYQEFITLRFDHIYKLEPLLVNTFSLPNASIYNNYTYFYIYIKDDQYSYYMYMYVYLYRLLMQLEF